MFTRTWSTSERKYDVVVDRDVKVRMLDGALLDGDIYRPKSEEKFPVILGAHAYNKNLQSPPMLPVGFTPMRGYMESGDSTFFARRGYVKAVAALGPKPLKAIFAPFAGTDDYRHRCYHGGILAHGFISHWRNSLHKPNYRSLYKEKHGEAAYKEAIALALRDEEIVAQPGLREALQNPDAGTNALIVDF